ncbi:Csf1p Ecym_4310 [Eremothecium cymbalariae DBVPG|uniref:Protein CSF1 n=1 Tax=Eremothecium cymbalariae (strain CBS 270.75 / DBVPG 7215 / KCTC 17166 / NRRL Y-17582) TaxID=931890 RepID=G8JTM0_ERECY|nr:hypothetical protein Ecym_4310 [Eremothecium cymbalariae DBVPG\
MDFQTEFEAIQVPYERRFGWVFLVNWAQLILINVFTTFYLWRAIGYIVTKILNWVIWKRYKVVINIQSLGFSIIGGKVYFKNISITDRDQTISILKGTFTWRYWLLNPRPTQLKNSNINDENSKCRFKLECDGVELFIYNKIAVYEDILNELAKSDKDSSRKFATDDESIFGRVKTDSSVMFDPLDESSEQSKVGQTILNSVSNQSAVPLYLDFLPAEVILSSGAVVVGNKHTPSVAIIQYARIEGIIDVAGPTSNLDQYKLRSEFELSSTRVSVKPNISFGNGSSSKKHKIDGKPFNLWQKLKDCLLFTISHILAFTGNKKGLTGQEEFLTSWKGLAMYDVATSDTFSDEIPFDLQNHEYAKYTTILNADRIKLLYSYDTPGVITETLIKGYENGDIPPSPEYSIDVQLYDANFYYGPWAHRQLQYFIKMFSPAVSRDFSAHRKPVLGKSREHANFRCEIVIMEDSVWRIPTKEPSKDAAFLDKYKSTNDESRAFGWIDIKLNKDTNISIELGLQASECGFENTFHANLVNPVIITSVNHDVLFNAKAHQIIARQSYPHQWNSAITWALHFISSDLELFILRDHFNLLVDLFTDFASGDAVPYELFRPVLYQFSWDISNYSLYLNANDANIVNNPLDFNENCYISIHGNSARIGVKLPIETISEESITISYEIYTPKFDIQLKTPPWHTLHEFMAQRFVGRSHEFSASGSYLSYNDVDIDNVDTINLECKTNHATFLAYGFLLRYVMNLKLNYFGEFAQFRTTEEYSEELAQRNDVATDIFNNNDDDQTTELVEPNSYGESGFDILHGKKIDKASLKRTVNEKDIWVTFFFEDGCFVLPESFYDFKSCFGLHFDNITFDMRYLSYYADLAFSMNSTYIKRYPDVSSNSVFDVCGSNPFITSNYDGYLSEFNIHIHRMFGLPPAEETYLFKIDVSLGYLSFESDIEALKGFIQFITKFSFGFDNFEDVLHYEMARSFDISCLSFFADDISIRLNNIDTNKFISLSIPNVSLKLLDFGTSKYSLRANIDIPNFDFLVSSMDDHNIVLGTISTSISFAIFSRNPDFKTTNNLQTQHILLSDAPFCRCSFLHPQEYQTSDLYKLLYASIPPSSSIPLLPEPIGPNNFDTIFENLLGDIYQDYISEGTFDISNDTKLQLNIDEFKKHSENSFSKHKTKNLTIDIVDELHEVRSFVFELPHINIDIHIDVLEVFADLYRQLTTFTISDTIDGLGVDIVNNFSKTFFGASSVTEAKVVCPRIDFRLRMYEYYALEDVKHYFVSDINKLDLNLRLRQEYDKESANSEMNSKNKLSVYYKTALINGKMLSKENFIYPSESSEFSYKSTFEELEGYAFYDDDLVTDANLQRGCVFINQEHSDSISEFIKTLYLKFNTFIKSVTISKNFNKSMKRELLIRIAQAGQDYGIQHDPPVITKPAVITRLSRHHVRESRSWRIVTRLRHVLNYLPQYWYETTSLELQKGKFRSEEDAKLQFLDIFTRWRSWEFADVERCFLYKKTYIPAEVTFAKTICFSSDLLTISFNERDKEHLFMNSFMIDIRNDCYVSSAVGESMAAKSNNVYKTVVSLDELQINVDKKIILKLSKLIHTLKFEYVYSNPIVVAKDANGRCKNISLQLNKITTNCFLGNVSLGFIFERIYVYSLIDTLDSGNNSLLSVLLFFDVAKLFFRYKTRNLFSLDFTDLHFNLTYLSKQKTYGFYHSAEFMNINSSIPSINDIIEANNEIRLHINEIGQDFASNIQYTELPVLPDSQVLKPIAMVKMNIAAINIQLQLLLPFILRYSCKEFEINVDFGRILQSSLSLQDTSVELLSLEFQEPYMKYSHSYLKLIGMDLGNTDNLGRISLDSSFSKLSIFEPKKNMRLFLSDIEQAVKNIEILRSTMLETKSSTVQNEFPFSRLIPIQLNLNVEYIGLLLDFGTTLYVLEFNNLEFSFSKDKTSSNPVVPTFSSDYSSESICFLIKDRRVKETLSKVLDFSLRIKVIRSSLLAIQSLQIESSYLHAVLSPMSLVRLLSFVNEFSIMKSIYHDIKPRSTSSNSTLSILPISIKSAHILSYNLCIGWLFDLGYNANEGLIWGYERLFAVYDKPYGKLTLLDAYFSVAHGFSSSTYYPDGNEKGAMNRSYLPSMQINYWLEEENGTKDLFIRVNGEELDVSLLAWWFTIVDEATQSLHKFKKLKETILDPLKVTSNDPILGEWNYLDNPLASSVRSINCIINYAGSSMKLYSRDDIQHGTCSFEIRSPAHTVTIDYKYYPSKKKSHWIRTLATVNTTHNTLFPVCVPLLNEMWLTFNTMLKNSCSQFSNGAPNLASAKAEINYRDLLEAFDIAVIINVGKQEISLTCEPTAKIQATIGFEKFDIKIFTNSMVPDEPLCLSVDLHNLMASSRHVFSREISSSLSLQQISMVFSLTHSEYIHTYGSTLISKPLFYFNVKQIEDLNLFLEIWSIEKQKSVNDIILAPVTASSFESVPSMPKLQRVPINATFSWDYLLIISEIGAEIDLGPSLGLVKVKSDNLWGLSSHNIDWTQKLLISMKEICMSSSGRLGGYVFIKDIVWKSKITWPIINNFHGVPLVELSLALGAFNTKLSFDYHMFFISTIQNAAIELFNQQDERGFLADLLSVSVSVDNIQVFITSLAYANLFDIYSTIRRMRNDSGRTNLDLLESNELKKISSFDNSKMLASLLSLRTELSVNAQLLNLHIFSTTLIGTEVVVLRTRKVIANTKNEASSKTTSDAKVQTELTWQLQDMSLSLSSFKHQLDENQLDKIDVIDYVKLASIIHGGIILEAPSIFVTMNTWQSQYSNVIELLYSSSFGNGVSITWNLRPINFIKDMWSIHINAMKLRHMQKGNSSEIHIPKDEDIEAKLAKVDLGTKYIYKPLEEPNIEMPKIKDLGDATPPVEWFGLNRSRFPGLTHQIVVVPLQKLSAVAEKEYVRILGKV